MLDDDAHLVRIRKVQSGRYVKTRVSLTRTGRTTLAGHLTALQRIAATAATDSPTAQVF